MPSILEFEMALPGPDDGKPIVQRSWNQTIIPTALSALTLSGSAGMVLSPSGLYAGRELSNDLDLETLL